MFFRFVKRKEYLIYHIQKIKNDINLWTVTALVVTVHILIR